MVIQIKSDNKPILRKLRKGVDMYYIEWYLKCVKYKEQEFKAKESGRILVRSLLCLF
jgi:hypothetical protein